MSVFLQAALSYARRGWYVFPCHARSKVPATAHGFKDATRDEAQIAEWWAEDPAFNVAIATGELGGMLPEALAPRWYSIGCAVYDVYIGALCYLPVLRR